MSYLEDAYLGDPMVAPMQLPTALTDQLKDHMFPLGADAPLPADMIRLPGGIVMKRNTALLLGAVLIIALVWYLTRKKKK